MFQKNRFLFVLLFAVQSLFAQIPQGFNYQATVRNQTGELLTNEYVGIRFHIVQGTEQNNPVYSELHYESTDDLGSLHLMIGQGAVEAGAFNQIDWSLGDYHMGIEINTGSGFIDMGTTQLMSVPFALYALNSGTTNNASLPQGNTVGDVLSWNGSAWTVATSSWNANLPEVNTYEANDISSFSSEVGGEVLYDGGSSITAKGVVWSENPDPTVALPTKTDEGPGPTFFRSQLTGLSPNTTYHYRAYATNSKGSAYGTSYVFTTEYRTNPLLIGEWVMWPNAGAMMVASSLDPETNGNWWANNLQDVGMRACFFDDKFVFSADKSFTNDVGDTTWDDFYFSNVGCVDAFAPYDGSVEASWIHDVEKGTVTLNGQGSYLGLKNVANGVELADATGAPSSRTYDIVSLTENVLSLRIAVDNEGGLDGENAYWYFILAKVGSEEAEIPQTDGDGDGVLDINDECPEEAGALATGCNPEGEVSTPTDAPAAPTAPEADVLSIFSDAYTDLAGSNFDPDWGQETDATIETYAGNEVLQYKKLYYQGLEYTQSDVSGYTKLHLDYWTADATSFDFFLISAEPTVENAYSIPVVTGSWQSVDISLSEYDANLDRVFQFKTLGDGTVILDNIYFY